MYEFKESSAGIKVPCPIHSNGHEKHPSCYLNTTNEDIEPLTYHCFTCQKSGPFYDFVSNCMDVSLEEAKNWLVDNFGNTILDYSIKLDDISLNSSIKASQYLDESILGKFESYHPYMTERKISDIIIDAFDIKYDKETQCLVFPVRDKYGRLIALTRRSIKNKSFIIDKDFNKCVYLLYNILENDIKEVVITESQINCLVASSYGKPAVALFGASVTDNQIKELNNTGVTHYILALDPDKAGLKGTLRLCKYLSKNKFVSVMILPREKDIGDLTQDEFYKCKIVDRYEFINQIPDYYTK